jgi:hypothetical protein
MLTNNAELEVGKQSTYEEQQGWGKWEEKYMRKIEGGKKGKSVEGGGGAVV